MSSPGRPGSTKTSTRGPAGVVDLPDRTPAPGPLGVRDRPSRGRHSQEAAGDPFAVLKRSEEFRRVFEEMTALGMKVKPSKHVSSRSTRRPGGAYDLYTNTFEIPENALLSRAPIRDETTLETVGHEVKHGHQVRSLIKQSNARGGTEAVRFELMDEIMARLGRGRFIEQFLYMEKDAERFGVRVTLEALGDAHKGLAIYREMFPGSSATDFANFKLRTWWSANSNLYERQAEYLWDEHRERTGG